MDNTFGHIGHNDTDQEDNGVQPMVSQYECNDEESDSKKDSDTSNNMNEVFDFAGDRRFSHSQTRGQVSDTTHYSPIAGVDHYSTGGALNAVGREEG